MSKKSTTSINAPFPDPQLNDTLGRCLTRICAWRSPPNWSAADWYQEMKAHAVYAACQAQQDYDQTRGGALCGFVYQRVIARAFTRYRQELTYARHYAPATETGESGDTDDFEDDPAVLEPSPLYEELLDALASLPGTQRSILDQTFWQEHTETELAITMGMSQPAVNKRKHLILSRLREKLCLAKKICGRRL